MNTIRNRAITLGLAGTIALTGVASASPGHRSYGRTFPIASTLCARVAAGHSPKRLKGQEAQVAQACQALQAGYTQAVNSVLNAEQSFKTAAHSARAQARLTCEQAPKPSHAACRQARKTAQQAIRSMRLELRVAVIAYRQGIESARHTFWATIHALRGGASIKPDAPQPGAPVPSS